MKKINIITLLISLLIIISCSKVYNPNLLLEGGGDAENNNLTEEEKENLKYDTVSNVDILPDRIINERLDNGKGWQLYQILRYEDSKWKTIEIGDCKLDDEYIFNSNLDTINKGTFNKNLKSLCSDEKVSDSFTDVEYKINSQKKIEYTNDGITDSIHVLKLDKNQLMIYIVGKKTSTDSGGGTSTTEKTQDMYIYLPKGDLDKIKLPNIND